MCSPTVLAVGSLAMTGVSTYLSYQGAKQQAEATQTASYYGAYQSEQQAVAREQQAVVQDTNQSYALWDAERAARAGALNESQLRRNIEKTKGLQLVGMAGANIDVASRSAIDVLAETAMLGEIDAMTLRESYITQSENFERTAYNAQTQAQLLRADAASFEVDAMYQRSTGQSINPTVAGLTAAAPAVASGLSSGYNFARYGAFGSLGSSLVATKA